MENKVIPAPHVKLMLQFLTPNNTEDVVVGQKKLKQMPGAMENVSESIIKTVSHFCTVLSSIVFSTHYLIIVSPQLCEVVSEDIIPIIT